MNRIVLVVFIFFSPFVFPAAYVETDNVKFTRFHTVAINNVDVENIMTFKINKPLEGGCLSLYLSKDDSVSQSMLIAARASSQEITFSYTEEIPPPWGDAKFCAVRWIQL